MPVRVPEDEGVAVVLSPQDVTHPGVAGQQPDAADGPVAGESLVHEAIEIHRLVGAVEPAHPDVHDADGEVGAGVAGGFDAGREVSGLGGGGHGGPFCRGAPS